MGGQGLLLAACDNPLGPIRPGEYGPRLEQAQLKSAETLDLEKRSEPEVDSSAEPADPRRGVLGRREGAGDFKLTVTVEQCRAWALENNLNLKVSMLAPEIAATAVSEEEARFEAAFVSSVQGSEADRARFETFPDQDLDPFKLDAGVRVPFITGGEALLRMPIERNETFGGFDTIDRWSTDFEISVSQPLLRNAGRWTNTHAIRIAALESQIVESRTKLEVIRVIADADRAYWLLYEATRVLRIRRAQFDQAQAQVRAAKSRFEGKLSPEIDVWRAQAGLGRRRAAIITAELQVRDRERTLKRIINLPDLDVDSTTGLVLSSLPDPVRYRLDAQSLISEALLQRVELLELELRLAQDMSTIDFTENQKLPLFTLDYAYRIDGRGRDIGSSFSDAGHVNADGWRIGLNMEVPLGNEAANARAHRAILTRLQRLSTRAAREQAVKQEILNALDNLEASWERIIAARDSVLLEDRNFRAEQGQFQLGARNSTDVLDAESRRAEAEVEEVNAIVDYQNAQVDLAYAAGMLLGAAKVSW